MKVALVLVAVVTLGALSASQTSQPASTQNRRADDPRCSQLQFSSAGALPSYHGPGFSTVSGLDPEVPFIVPAGCSQFSCTVRREAYQVLSCPNLRAKSISRTMDTNGAAGSTPAANSVHGSK